LHLDQIFGRPFSSRLSTARGRPPLSTARMRSSDVAAQRQHIGHRGCGRCGTAACAVRCWLAVYRRRRVAWPSIAVGMWLAVDTCLRTSAARCVGPLRLFVASSGSPHTSASRCGQAAIASAPPSPRAGSIQPQARLPRPPRSVRSRRSCELLVRAARAGVAAPLLGRCAQCRTHRTAIRTATARAPLLIVGMVAVAAVADPSRRRRPTARPDR
jgi:hypothetical protein